MHMFLNAWVSTTGRTNPSVLSKELSRAFSRKEYASMLSMKVSPGSYDCAEQYWRDLQRVKLLGSLQVKLPGLDPDAAALELFLASERQCFVMNQRFSEFLDHPCLARPRDRALYDLLREIKEEISGILGRVPDEIRPTFTAGADLSNSSKNCSLMDKLTSGNTTYSHTGWTTGYLQRFRDRCKESESDVVEHVESNVLFFVPKKSSVSRICAKEASEAIRLQRGIGVVIRDRLRPYVDILAAQPKHRTLARQGSIDGRYVTLDLKSASDTISRNLVRCILPELWFLLLDSLRARRTRLPDGREIFLEKFSSMGNGFTFELETLIFLAAMRVVLGRTGYPKHACSVYGDDIVIPVGSARYAKVVLSVLGFTLNDDKSFTRGPFRESCGGDFWNGVPVRAAKLEKIPTEPHEWISLHNALVGACAGIPSRLRFLADFLRWIRNQLPSNVRSCKGPSWLGDTVLHVDHDPIMRGGQPYTYAWTPVPVRYNMDRWGSADAQLIARILVPSSLGVVTPRGQVSGYKRRLVPLWGLAD